MATRWTSASCFDAVGRPLVMLDLEEPDIAVAEAEWRHDRAPRLGPGRLDAAVAQRVDHDDRTARLQRQLAKQGVILSQGLAVSLGARRLRHAAAILGRVARAIDEAQVVVLQLPDPEVRPVHEPVRQPLDQGARLDKGDVRGDDVFHGVDDVLLLGGDRLLEDPLEHVAGGEHDEQDRPGAPAVGRDARSSRHTPPRSRRRR